MSISPTNPESSSGSETVQRRKITLKTLNRMKRLGEQIACLACYDATSARWLERAGVHVLLAGDSAAQVILGYERTIDMPIEFAIEMTSALKRGAPDTLIMADMPFMTYHVSEEDAMKNAARFMIKGQADVVKIECDRHQASLVQSLTRAGIPICAHIGCRPQSSSLTGGPMAAGRTAELLQEIVDDAITLQQAGAVLILVEAVPPDVTRAIMEAVSVPVIGIGAGTDCDGQILVVNDLVGLTDYPPRFAQAVDEAGLRLERAGREWVDRVQKGTIGGQEYTMKSDSISKNTGVDQSSPIPTRTK